MAYCAYCGRDISDQALACPGCGHPNEALNRRLVVAGVYAGFWRRFAGLLIDGLILSVVTIPLTDVHRTQGDLLVSNPYLPVFSFLYHWLTIAFARGQTIGKMVMRIRITRPGGVPVDPGRAAARAGMALISSLAFGLGYLWAAWDPERRTWHDMVADTRAYPVRR